MPNTAQLRRLDTAKGLTPAELELINYNWWAIEQALKSVGAVTPGVDQQISQTGVTPPSEESVVIKHDQLLELADDDHLQYAKLTGRTNDIQYWRDGSGIKVEINGALAYIKINNNLVAVLTGVNQTWTHENTFEDDVTIKAPAILKFLQTDVGFSSRLQSIGLSADRDLLLPNENGTLEIKGKDLLSASHGDTLAGSVVRGDLIVGNSTPKWSRLPKGSANQVLLMDSGGNDPGWGVLDNTHIANRTRIIWIPASVFLSTISLSSNGTFPDQYAFIAMSGVVPTTDLVSSFILPNDFVSVVQWEILYCNHAADANPFHINLSALSPASGSSATAAADITISTDLTPSGVVDRFTIQTLGSTGTNLSAGDWVRLAVQRDPANVGDTNTTQINFIGIRLLYTADM